MLDLLGRCLKLSVSTESISCHDFAFQFVLAIVLYAKNINNLGEIGWVARVFSSMVLLPAMNTSGAVGHGWSQMNCTNLYAGGDGGVCVCVCERARAYVCVLAHACASVRGRACVMCLQYTIIIFELG